MEDKYTNNDIFKITECPSDALLLAYAKGETNADDKRNIELHLIDCDMCNDMVEGYQRMHPTQIEANIKSLEAKIDQAIIENSNNKGGSAGFKWYYAAAAVLLIGLTGVIYNLYFNSIDQTKVADLPQTQETEHIYQIDSTENIKKVEVQEEHQEAEIKVVTPEVQKPVEQTKSIKIPAREMAESAKDQESLEAPALSMEAKPLAEPVAVSENKNLDLTSANTPLEINTVSPTTSYSWSPASGTAAQSPTSITVVPNSSLDATNLYSIETKKSASDNKKEDKSNKKTTEKNKAKASQSDDVVEDLKAEEETAAMKYKVATIDLLRNAQQQLNLKQYKEALINFNQYLKTNPNNCDALNGRATCYDMTNKTAEAIIDYTKLAKIKCGKQSDGAYLKLGTLYLKNKQPQEAKLVLQKAMQSKYLDIAEQAKKELDKL
jgi:Flp pilus assembly protein TadD